MRLLLAFLAMTLGGVAAAADNPGDTEIAFDRNKGALYAIYARALRDNPRLAGRVVLEIDVAKSGDVRDCRVVSSTMNAPEVEQKFCARMLTVRYKPRDSDITLTKPLEFFPAN